LERRLTWLSRDGRNNMTPETKAKISQSMMGNTNGTGYVPTPGHRRNMSRAMFKWHRERRRLIERLKNDTMQGL